MRFIFACFLLVLILLVSAFAMLNAQPVTLQLLVAKIDIPLIVSLFCALFLGVMLSAVVFLGTIFRLRLRCQWLKSQLKRIEEASPTVLTQDKGPFQKIEGT